MRISIKRNKHKEKWDCCNNCGTEFYYKNKDVIRDTSRGYLRFFVKCPNCKKLIEVYILPEK